MKLIKRTEIQKPNEVYNLHVKNDHNYVVNGAVVSNCHQASADVLKKLMTGVMAHIPIRWGFTGTVPKLPFHYVPLKIGIGEVVGKLSASELQESGVLSNCHVNVIQMVDYPVYPSYQTEMKYLLTTPERIEFIAGMIRDISESGNTLVLVDRIPTGKMLTSLIPGAVFVHGNVKSKDRQAEYDEIAIIDNKTIVATYGVAAVGINIPRIFNMVMLEPGKSFTRVIQSIGRGIRKAEDKDFVQIWDFTSTCKFVKRQLTVRKKFYAEANYPYTIKKITWM